MPIHDIKVKSNPQIETILAEYCEDMNVSSQECKQFFREWNTKVSANIIMQCVFAGIFWAKKHPEDVMITEVCG